MKKTALDELIYFIENNENVDINSIKKKSIELISTERNQILDSFDSGVSYGNGILQTFDYPGSRYYQYTYRNPEPLEKC